MKSDLNIYFPDSLFKHQNLSLSTLLYFDEPIYLTLHPTVSMFTAGCDPFDFQQFVSKSNYTWKESFLVVFNLWYESQILLEKTFALLDPLIKNKNIKTTWLVYSRTSEALKKAEEIVKSTNLSTEELMKVINLHMAAQEVMAHILFEKFLEFYGNLNKTGETKSYTSHKPIENIDYTLLTDYCKFFFESKSLEENLINAYFLRINHLDSYNKILLSNEGLITFLSKIPKNADSPLTYYENIDIIGWEIFRQLTSKIIDSKDFETSVGFVISLLNDHKEEISNLKNKCLKLSEQYKGEKDLSSLIKNISQHIKINTEKEVKDLLDISKKPINNLFNEMFADEKTWVALGSFIVSAIAGGTLITASVALAGIANLGAKAFKLANKNNEKIKNSDFSLIYRMNNI